ncbi:MAG: metallophosphoesterase [Bacillota bacterium]|nr:metallophosphoesterase [Bacillota bacterium]
MSIFAIGDLHLSLSSDKPMDVYGGQWVGHVKKIEESWRRSVKSEDVVILAGDISWALKPGDAAADLDWIARLPGKKVLVRGNHDLWWTSVSRLNALHTDMYFLQNTYYKAGDYAICGSRGWLCPGDKEFTAHDEKIYRRELLRLGFSLEAAAGAGEKNLIGVLHYPPCNEGLEGSGFTELFEEYGVRLVVYGHLHGAEAHKKALGGFFRGVEYRLVACDHVNCRPVKLIENHGGPEPETAAVEGAEEE